jgi:hypothetical protein
MILRDEQISADSIKLSRFQAHWNALKNSSNLSEGQEIDLTWHFITAMQLLDQEMQETVKETPKNNNKKTRIDGMRRATLDLYMEKIRRQIPRKRTTTPLTSNEEETPWNDLVNLLVNNYLE